MGRRRHSILFAGLAAIALAGFQSAVNSEPAEQHDMALVGDDCRAEAHISRSSTDKARAGLKYPIGTKLANGTFKLVLSRPWFIDTRHA